METPKIREFQHERLAAYRATISCAIGIALLASCASQEAITRLNAAEAEMESLRNSKMMVFFELIDPSLSEEQEVAEMKRMFEASTPCMVTYGERLEAALDYAMQALKDHGNRGPAYRLASYAERLDEFYSSCVASYGATGYNYMETMDGRELRWPDYIRSVMASAQSRQRANSQVLYEEQQNAMIFSAIAIGLGAGLAGSTGSHSVNPDRVYIDNYRKYDGSYVRGHWRTVPNYTCLDNINGC